MTNEINIYSSTKDSYRSGSIDVDGKPLAYAFPLFVKDLEAAKDFFVTFLGGKSNDGYHNKKTDLLKTSYLCDSEVEKAEVRRLELWFDKKFYNEVSKYILEERVYNTFLDEMVDINTKRLKAGQKNLDSHLRYMEYLLDSRKWLAGENFSLADISAATQISSLDYLGEISWSKYRILKDWYLTIKSKVAFRGILGDKIEGFKPSKHYCEFDFD